MTGGAAYARALDHVAAAVVSGRWPAGHATTVDALVAETGVSRSIVREVTRELVAARLLSASPRVGLRVRPREDWDVLDLRVVRLRLAVGDRDAQVRELRQLRAAVEPEAAALAAGAMRGAAALQAAAAAMARAADPEAFLAADRRFHDALLAASGNAMLAGLGALVDTALQDRALVARSGLAPSPLDVGLHGAVADAVAAGDGAAARDRMRRIVDLTA